MGFRKYLPSGLQNTPSEMLAVVVILVMMMLCGGPSIASSIITAPDNLYNSIRGNKEDAECLVEQIRPKVDPEALGGELVIDCGAESEVGRALLPVNEEEYKFYKKGGRILIYYSENDSSKIMTQETFKRYEPIDGTGTLIFALIWWSGCALFFFAVYRFFNPAKSDEEILQQHLEREQMLRNKKK